MDTFSCKDWIVQGLAMLCPRILSLEKHRSPCPAHAPIMIPRTFPRVGWGGLIAKQIIPLRLCGETRTNTHAQTYKLLSSLHNMPHRPQIHATVLAIYRISCPTTSHGCKGGRGHAWTHFHARIGQFRDSLCCAQGF